MKCRAAAPATAEPYCPPSWPWPARARQGGGMHSSTPTAPDEGHNPPMAPKTIAGGGQGNDPVLDVLRPEFQEGNGPLTHSRVTEFGVFFGHHVLSGRPEPFFRHGRTASWTLNLGTTASARRLCGDE
jgi:hypothetical protein